MVPGGIRIIESDAFIDKELGENYYIEKCCLPEGVTTIKKGAFALCKSLRSVILPSSLITIEDNVFLASGLQSIDLPEGLEVLGRNVFTYCSGIKELRLPSSIRSIGKYCFDQMGVAPEDMFRPGVKGALIIAPLNLFNIYDEDYLEKLFKNHEVNWY